MAVVKDNFYKFIGGGRSDLFWRMMLKNKPNDYYSEEFKDLVTKMIDVRERRINMSDIQSHPWYTSEDVPTEEEIISEFEIREKKAKAALE